MKEPETEIFHEVFLFGQRRIVLIVEFKNSARYFWSDLEKVSSSFTPSNAWGPRLLRSNSFYDVCTMLVCFLPSRGVLIASTNSPVPISGKYRSARVFFLWMMKITISDSEIQSGWWKYVKRLSSESWRKFFANLGPDKKGWVDQRDHLSASPPSPCLCTLSTLKDYPRPSK